MTVHDLAGIRRWFGEFCSSYRCEDPLEQMNIELKHEHSLKVSENALAIARGEAFSPAEQCLAEVVGLLHDTGRFPQYAEYKTFRDGVSVNHGQLGADTLARLGVLQGLPADLQELIITAVRFHNVFHVPELADSNMLRHLRLARDADKLDIWRVFAEYYEAPDERKADAVSLGLPDEDGYSEELIANLMGGEVSRLASLRTLNDFKILQLSWVYDLNFSSTYRLLLERRCIDRIAATLPQTADIISAVENVRQYAWSRAGKALK